jgi:hypothetical protein
MTTQSHLKLEPAVADDAVSGDAEATEDTSREGASWRTSLILVAILTTAFLVRTWNLMALGFNSDEAVYAGQASSIAGNPELLPYFPIFRAHPLLFQSLISIPYQIAVSPLVGRLMSVAFGVATVYLVYLVGKTMYSRGVGMIAALIVALMPYHVVVTRQILLDGPLAFFATLSLLLLAQYGRTRNLMWFYASFAAMGLTVLAKETGIIMFGAIYIFVALLGTVRLRHMVAASLLWLLVVLPYPVSVAMSGRSSTGGQFIAWQLFRRANHPWYFYFTEVPPEMGYVVLVFAVVALVYMRKRWTWTETLLTSWIVIPVVFFVLFPVKGFQYLLPVAIPMAVLAAVGIMSFARIDFRIGAWRMRAPVLSQLAVALVAALLLVATVTSIDPQRQSTDFLAGSGGVPGGREAGEWVGENTPKGAQILALGPSMANIIQFYGDRKAFGLSVSPNPLHRNPVYEPINNPDLWIRSNDLQYIIWDSYSASRSSFFSDRLLNYAERYNGRIVHTEFVEVPTDAGESVEKPVIIIYEVRP